MEGMYSLRSRIDEQRCGEAFGAGRQYDLHCGLPGLEQHGWGDVAEMGRNDACLLQAGCAPTTPFHLVAVR